MRILTEASHEPAGFSLELMPGFRPTPIYTMLVILTIVAGGATAAGLT